MPPKKRVEGEESEKGTRAGSEEIRPVVAEETQKTNKCPTCGRDLPNT